MKFSKMILTALILMPTLCLANTTESKEQQFDRYQLKNKNVALYVCQAITKIGFVTSPPDAGPTSNIVATSEDIATSVFANQVGEIDSRGAFVIKGSDQLILGLYCYLGRQRAIPAYLKQGNI